MKRDLDLIRSMLMYIEAREDRVINYDEIANALGRNEDEIVFHVELLVDCGYLKLKILSAPSVGIIDSYIERITSLGYDYLDNVRDSKVYAEVKRRLKQVTSFSLDVVKQVAAEIIIALAKA